MQTIVKSDLLLPLAPRVSVPFGSTTVSYQLCWLVRLRTVNLISERLNARNSKHITAASSSTCE